MIIFIKLFNIINFLITQIFIKIIFLFPRNIKPKTILLIKLDAIGDYILARNFFRLIKEDDKYKNYKITLCGNIIWKDLAESLDKEVFENFLWLDKRKFKRNLLYKYRFLKDIYNSGFEIAVDTIYSREISYGDSIVKTSKANERIGSSGSLGRYVKWKRNLSSNSYYNRLLSVAEENIFEFFRNKEFFESFLGKKIEITKPSIDISNILLNYNLRPGYFIVSPGANYKYKKWSVNNYCKVIKYLLQNSNSDIIIEGSQKESPVAKQILTTIPDDRIKDFTGTSLVELSKHISDAKLLISNESSSAHFAAATNTTFICISNGIYFGRFHPYPKEIFDKGYYIYPPEIMNNLDNPEFLKSKYRFSSNLNINSIKAEDVINLVKQILSTFK
jgi:ADP-heptose:LPS heptosyltransferase